MKRVITALALILALGPGFSASAADAQSPAGSGAWGPLDMQSAVVQPGMKAKFTFLGDRSFEGSFLDTALWTARGAKPGPTLCVIAGIHGDEINSVEIARRSFHTVDATRLAGTLIVVPAVNALGFQTMNRYMIDRRDLNRAFPGSVKGSVASIVAYFLFERVVRQCNYLIDLHTGSNFRANVAQIRVDVEDADSLELARHFGIGVIIGGAGPSGSLRREAVDAGVAAIIYEAGPPYAFLEKEIELGTRGVLNVLNHLGMFESGAKSQPTRMLASSSWVRVPLGNGGIFMTNTGLGDQVKKGQLLGTVTDPITDDIHEIRSPRDGVVIGAAIPQVVLSGYGVFHIGTID